MYNWEKSVGWHREFYKLEIAYKLLIIKCLQVRRRKLHEKRGMIVWSCWKLSINLTFIVCTHLVGWESNGAICAKTLTTDNYPPKYYDTCTMISSKTTNSLHLQRYEEISINICHGNLIILIEDCILENCTIMVNTILH